MRGSGAPTPRLGATGPPDLRFAFLRRAEVTVHDTWWVAGLRGTGSHDWEVTDAFVPMALSGLPMAASPWAGSLCRLPPGTVINALHFSAVATGIARRAIDGLVDLALTKTPADARGLLRRWR